MMTIMKVKPIGCLYESDFPLSSAREYTVFDKNGLCPTLNAMGGGGRQPFIIEGKKDGRSVQGSFGVRREVQGK